MSKPDSGTIVQIVDVILIRQVLNGKSADVLRVFLKYGGNIFMMPIPKEFFLRMLQEIEAEELAASLSSSSPAKLDSKDDSFQFSLPKPVKEKLAEIGKSFLPEEETKSGVKGFLEQTKDKLAKKVARQTATIDSSALAEEEEVEEPEYKSRLYPGDSDKVKKYLTAETVSSFYSYGNHNGLTEKLETYFQELSRSQERELSVEEEARERKGKPPEPASSSSSSAAPAVSNKVKYRVREQVIISLKGGKLFEEKNGGVERMAEEHPTYKDEVGEKSAPSSPLLSSAPAPAVEGPSETEALKKEGHHVGFPEPIMLDKDGNVDPKIYISPAVQNGDKFTKSVTIILPENKGKLFTLPEHFENAANIHVVGSGLNGTRRLKRRVIVNLLTGEVEVEKQIYQQINGVVSPIPFDSLSQQEIALIQATNISVDIKRISIPQKEKELVKKKELKKKADEFEIDSESSDPELDFGDAEADKTPKQETPKEPEADEPPLDLEDPDVITKDDTELTKDTSKQFRDFLEVAHLQALHDGHEAIRGGGGDIEQIATDAVIKARERAKDAGFKDQEHRDSVIAGLGEAVAADARELMHDKSSFKKVLRAQDLKADPEYKRILENADTIAGETQEVGSKIFKKDDPLHGQVKTQQIRNYEGLLTSAFQERLDNEGHEKKAAEEMGALISAQLTGVNQRNFGIILKRYIDGIHTTDLTKSVPGEDDTQSIKGKKVQAFAHAMMAGLDKVKFDEARSDQGVNRDAAEDLIGKLTRVMVKALLVEAKAPQKEPAADLSHSTPVKPKAPQLSVVVPPAISKSPVKLLQVLGGKKDDQKKQQQEPKKSTQEGIRSRMQEKIDDHAKYKEELYKALKDLTPELNGRGDWKRALIIKYLEAEYVEGYLQNVADKIAENDSGPSLMASPSRKPRVTEALKVDSHTISEDISKHISLTYELLGMQIGGDQKAGALVFKGAKHEGEKAKLEALLKMSFYDIVDKIIEREVQVLKLLEKVNDSSIKDSRSQTDTAGDACKRIRPTFRDGIGRRANIRGMVAMIDKNLHIEAGDLRGREALASAALTVPSTVTKPIVGQGVIVGGDGSQIVS